MFLLFIDLAVMNFCIRITLLFYPPNLDLFNQLILIGCVTLDSVFYIKKLFGVSFILY